MMDPLTTRCTPAIAKVLVAIATVIGDGFRFFAAWIHSNEQKTESLRLEQERQKRVRETRQRRILRKLHYMQKGLKQVRGFALAAMIMSLSGWIGFGIVLLKYAH